tara:strand:- start:3155 stop:4198 length:1044 start_codon:yes stop_codon:yes gene_type:complete
MNDNFNEYKDKGLTGLANVGNSCYLNACMQILSHTYELNHFLNNKSYKKKLNKSNNADSMLLVEWDKLRQLMWSSNCTIAPHGFVNAVHQVSVIKERALFTGYNQNDIQEFLILLIDSFHNALSRGVTMQIEGHEKSTTDKLAVKCYEMLKTMYENEYSEIIELFYGIHISRITSKTREILSDRPEPFSILSLPIPNNKTPTLYDCMDEYCKKEELFGDDAWMNDNTNKKQDVYRGIIFWSLPDVLIIDLKRWNIKGNKINVLVDAVLDNFNLSKYVQGYKKEQYIYDLFGVCNHSGISDGGHYTAVIKNANGKWYNFNDTMVNEVNSSSIITPYSYCFFYRKKKIN